MKYSIDRFEGEMAVLIPEEDAAGMLTLPREALPQGVQEGDLLEATESGWSVLVDETKDRRLRLLARRKRLMGGNP